LKFQIRGWVSVSTVVVGGLHAYVYRVPDREVSCEIGGGTAP